MLSIFGIPRLSLSCCDSRSSRPSHLPLFALRQPSFFITMAYLKYHITFSFFFLLSLNPFV